LLACAVPPSPQWYTEAEKINGRWAMAAVAGILATDLLGKPKWFDAGAQDYWIDNNSLLAIEFLVLGFLELKRFQVGAGWGLTGEPR
jgi:light-harvesting complex I chlorophyll a/b binding protein 5